MKKLMLAAGLLAVMSGTPGLVAPAWAQPTPPGPGAGPDHAKIEAALQQLDLKPRQKLELAKIMKQAKASGQDKKATLEQVMGVLDANQKQKLMGIIKEKGQEKAQSK